MGISHCCYIAWSSMLHPCFMPCDMHMGCHVTVLHAATRFKEPLHCLELHVKHREEGSRPAVQQSCKVRHTVLLLPMEVTISVPWGTRFSLTVVGETMAHRLLENSALATPSSATPTPAVHSQPVPPQPGSTPKGKGSARGRGTKKGTTRRQATPDHSPPDHTPLTISSSSPECIPIAPPAQEITYGRFTQVE